jgi:hypothetical protein
MKWKIKMKIEGIDFAIAKSVSRLRRPNLARFEQARRLKWSLYQLELVYRPPKRANGSRALPWSRPLAWKMKM